MAKPIEATPALEDKDAEAFVNDLIRPKYTTKEKKLFKELKELEATIPKN